MQRTRYASEEFALDTQPSGISGDTHVKEIGEANQEEVATSALTDLVWTIALLYKRRPVRRQLPERATYRELTAVLKRTFPPSMRALMEPCADRSSSNLSSDSNDISA